MIDFGSIIFLYSNLFHVLIFFFVCLFVSEQALVLWDSFDGKQMSKWMDHGTTARDLLQDPEHHALLEEGYPSDDKTAFIFPGTTVKSAKDFTHFVKGAVYFLCRGIIMN
jgi:hypothetical protein